MGAVLSRPPKRGLNTHRRAAIGLRQYAALVGLLAQANTPDLAGALQYPNAHRPIAALGETSPTQKQKKELYTIDIFILRIEFKD